MRAAVASANVELVRQVIEAHERRDFEAVFAAYDPGIEWHVGRLLPHAPLDFEPVYHGHAGVRRFFRQWLSAWETVSFEYEELIDAGEHVVVFLNQRMRGRTSGMEIDWPDYAQVWTVRGGKIVCSEFFLDRQEALEAAGV